MWAKFGVNVTEKSLKKSIIVRVIGYNISITTFGTFYWEFLHVLLGQIARRT